MMRVSQEKWLSVSGRVAAESEPLGRGPRVSQAARLTEWLGQMCVCVCEADRSAERTVTAGRRHRRCRCARTCAVPPPERADACRGAALRWRPPSRRDAAHCPRRPLGRDTCQSRAAGRPTTAPPSSYEDTCFQPRWDDETPQKATLHFILVYF